MLQVNKKTSKTVVLTTVFPACKEYLEEYFNSLKKQTDTNFDILVINDGIDDFEECLLAHDILHVIEYKVSESTAKNRELGINYAVELGYEHIVFADSDDYFSANRIELTISALVDNDIVFNELVLFDKEQTINDFLVSNLSEIRIDPQSLLKSNILGLSNTAIRTSIIKKKVVFNENLIAVDWYFFSTLIYDGNPKIAFLKEVNTYYRQYNANTVGMNYRLTDQKLNLILKTKEIHYREMILFCSTNLLKDYQVSFEKQLYCVKKLKREFTVNSFKEKYINIVNFKIREIFSGWWSELISLEDFKYYENSIG